MTNNLETFAAFEEIANVMPYILAICLILIAIGLVGLWWSGRVDNDAKEEG